MTPQEEIEALYASIARMHSKIGRMKAEIRALTKKNVMRRNIIVALQRNARK